MIEHKICGHIHSMLCGALARCRALAQVCAKSFGTCATACARSGRWHEICVGILTQCMVFHSSRSHNMAIITHLFCHVEYHLKQAKMTKIMLEIDNRAQNTWAVSRHVVLCSGKVPCPCTSVCKKFRHMCHSLCEVRQMA